MFNNSKRIDVAWGNGNTCMFVRFSSDGCAELFDYEFDYEFLHNMCGGKNYYQSRSGASGAGFFDRLGDLVQVGLYRVDTMYNDWQWPLSVGKRDYEDVMVMVPYVSHQSDKGEVLQRYPTVIKFGHTIIYCSFRRNFVQTLQTILSGEDLPEENHKTLRRAFTRPDYYLPTLRTDDVVIEFYDYTGDNLDPWEFCKKELSPFLSGGAERMYQLLGVERIDEEFTTEFVRTVKINNLRYRGRIISAGDPLKTGELTAGWGRIDSNLIIRPYTRSNEMHLVAYSNADEVYNKVAKRVAGRMGEGEEFISFVSAHEGEYVEYEQVISKVLYLLAPEKYQGEVRKGLARKIREDVMNRVAQWVEEIEDQALLDAIPDDLEITVEDSYSAGNCEPGTQAWLKEHAGGRTSCTAGELKKAASNYYIMRIFRYLAVREGLIKKGE